MKKKKKTKPVHVYARNAGLRFGTIACDPNNEAYHVVSEGRVTDDRAKVTCKNCLGILGGKRPWALS
jgi:hypothetical protein